MRSACRARSRKRGIAGSIDSPILIVMSAPSARVASNAGPGTCTRSACLDRLAGLGVDELQPHSVPRRAVDESQPARCPSPSTWRSPHSRSAISTLRRSHPFARHPVLGRGPAPSGVVLGRRTRIPAAARRRSRSASVARLMPSRATRSSKRRTPFITSRMTSMLHRSPNRSSDPATGHGRGGNCFQSTRLAARPTRHGPRPLTRRAPSRPATTRSMLTRCSSMRRATMRSSLSGIASIA